jgi:hypothetical protein
MKRFSDVQFVTTAEATALYRDRARGRKFPAAELKAFAAACSDEVCFQTRADYTLSASETFVLLNENLATKAAERGSVTVTLHGTPLGPSDGVARLPGPITVPTNQLLRTAEDVADFIRKHERIPGSIWLGSTPVPPEAYVCAVARLTGDLIDGRPLPMTVTVAPARLAAGKYVADDAPNLWEWVILPSGFRAPAMMDLARQQAWSLKPAVLDRSAR